MTTDEIIAMAEQAGYPHVGLKWNDQEQAFLMRFAALVAAKEREACARVCESWGGRDYEKCAAAIRAKGKPWAAAPTQPVPAAVVCPHVTDAMVLAALRVQHTAAGL